MSKTLLAAGAALVIALGMATGTAEAKSNRGISQSNSFGNNGHVKANNIRLCNNRCTISGDNAGNIVGIGNQNFGNNRGKSHGHHKHGW